MDLPPGIRWAEIERLLPEQRVGPYEIVRELGRGGMATVYLARDLKHERPVALKLLHTQLASALGPERFLLEIRQAARLRHPHILPVFDSGKTEGRLWYTMPYVEGESLRQRLHRERRLPVEAAVRIAREIAEALDYAHRQGVIHRDIKPENILLEDGQAVLADFGIARAIGAAREEQLTGTGFLLGTPAYMSPEQVDGQRELDGRSDIYSLGCVLFEMLAGGPPYKGVTLGAIIANRVIGPVPSARASDGEISEALDTAVRRALASAPSERYPTAAAFVEAITRSGEQGDWGVSSASPIERPAIAVLPFANLGSDQGNDYFSEGITEELIHALARIPQVRVASRTSVFSIAKKDLDIRQIGEALGVGSVLEGTVRRAGNRLRISAQLVDTRSGYHRWSEMYDRELEDVFAIQNEISRAIIAQLRVSLGRSDPSLVEPATTSMEAYHSYLRGRYFWNRPSQESLLKAVEHFQRAISSDPDYASAHSGLADGYYVLAVFGVLPPQEISPQIKTAALRAVELDPSRAEGHVSLGCAAMCFDWDWDAALGHFQRAIELDPTYAHAHYQCAWCLTAMGRDGEAVAAARRAAELEPLSLHIQAYVAQILGLCRRFDAAVEQARSTLELDPGFIPAIEALGHAYTYARRYDEALATFRRVPPSARVSQALRLAPVYARLGEAELARHTLDDEEARLASDPAQAGNAGFYLASAALGLGDIERCLFWLERLVEERRFLGCLLKAEPSWDDIRTHPRFLALLRKLRLE